MENIDLVKEKDQISKQFNAAIIFHRVDYDGVFSCCIAENYLENNPNCIEYQTIGYTYGDDMPDFKGLYESGVDYFIIQDVSFPKETMLYLKELYTSGKLKGLVWIDHHYTAIDDSIANSYNDIPGIRSTKKAACEYSWEYFHPAGLCPDIICYLSAYDIWDQGRFDWNDLVLPLQYSLREKYGVSEEKIMEDFDELIYMSPEDLEEFILSGRKLLEFKRRGWKSAIKNYSFEITVANRFRGLAILGTEFNSQVFGEKVLEYDVVCVANRKSPDSFNCSLYIDPSSNIDFNAGEYLKENYGGGGHEKAAGCSLTLEQFTRLIKDCII